MSLIQLHNAVRHRAAAITAARPDWPCRKGCDECCRTLAAVPLVSEPEWRLLDAALDDTLRDRIRDSASAARPIICPLLDTTAGACLVYEARPVACRSYGFYAERQYVLGCRRIEAMAGEAPGVVWGNHLALEVELATLGPAKPLYDWV